MASRKPPSVASANASLQRLASLGAVGPTTGGWRPFSRLLRILPRGVDAKLTTRVLEKVIANLGARYLSGGISPNVLDEVMAALEKFPREAASVFALTGLRLSDHPERELSDWLGQQGLKDAWQCRKRRKELAVPLTSPAVIAAAQAAFAVTPIEDWWESPHLPLIAADASPESLDILTSLLVQLRTRGDWNLDRFREWVVPLIGETAGGVALKKSLDDTVQARTANSPARVFCVAIGLDPPPKQLIFRARFFTPEGEPSWAVKADSTRATWFEIQPRRSWGWTPIADPLRDLRAGLDKFRDQRARVTLRASGKDVDRPKLQRWLETFLT